MTKTKQTHTIQHTKHELKETSTGSVIEIGEIEQLEDGTFISAMIRKPSIRSIEEIDAITDFLITVRESMLK